MVFREVLRQFRERAGLTQEGLALKSGMSVGNVRNYEQGIRLPSFPQVVKLATALGLSCEDFAACSDVASPAGPASPAPKPGRAGRKK